MKNQFFSLLMMSVFIGKFTGSVNYAEDEAFIIASRQFAGPGYYMNMYKHIISIDSVGTLTLYTEQSDSDYITLESDAPNSEKKFQKRQWKILSKQLKRVIFGNLKRI